MRLATEYVRPLLFGMNAFDRARAFYAPFENHPDPDKRLCFEDDVAEYLRFGFVVSRPTCFAMAKVINIAPEETNLVEPAWFIRFAVGSLEEVLTLLPVALPKIVWCRRNDGKLRIYKTATLYRIARARIKKGK